MTKTTNLERYEKDLKRLIAQGGLLLYAMQHKCRREQFEEALKQEYKDKAARIIERLPDFEMEYQKWYSEAQALIKQLLPDRVDDFTRHYEKPKSRKDITHENYKIEDYLQGLNVTHWNETIVGPNSAIPHMTQQLAILKSVEARFESSLFDIRQIVQADLFDSELDAARELLKNGYDRAAGMIAGVVLEIHLAQVCTNHNLTTRKKRPTISDFYDMLKKEQVIDTPSWRQLQRLADLRNLCAHGNDRDPTSDEVEELISGAEKFTKSLF